MAYINDLSFDAALNYIETNTTHLYVTSTEATTYDQASNTLKLGTKATPTFTGPVNGDTSGRKTTVDAITDGTVDTTGTAGFWALTSASVLISTGSLAAPQGVTSGNTFTLTAIDIEIPDAV